MTFELGPDVQGSSIQYSWMMIICAIIGHRTGSDSAPILSCLNKKTAVAVNELRNISELPLGQKTSCARQYSQPVVPRKYSSDIHFITLSLNFWISMFDLQRVCRLTHHGTLAPCGIVSDLPSYLSTRWVSSTRHSETLVNHHATKSCHEDHKQCWCRNKTNWWQTKGTLR